MGEAKRRREAANRALKYRDTNTGETVMVRHAGDPWEFYELMGAQGQRVIDEGPGAVDARVPCNGCRECCHHAGVDVHPEQEPPERLAILQTERRADGLLYLRKREDGACVHLGPLGCTVYEHRPNACRGYDCRIYALTNVLDRFTGGHEQPRWMFEPKTAESRAFLAACQMTGLLKLNQADREGGDRSANGVAEAVFGDHAMLDKAQAAFFELVKLPPGELADALGFDPRTVTQERLAEVLNAMSGGRAQVMFRD